MLLVKNDIHLVPIWILTKANELADDLSRFRYRKIADQHPQLKILPISPPSKDETHQNDGINSPLCPERPLAFSGGV